VAAQQQEQQEQEQQPQQAEELEDLALPKFMPFAPRVSFCCFAALLCGASLCCVSRCGRAFTLLLLCGASLCCVSRCGRAFTLLLIIHTPSRPAERAAAGDA
jgi:hypothetical protein